MSRTDYSRFMLIKSKKATVIAHEVEIEAVYARHSSWEHINSLRTIMVLSMLDAKETQEAKKIMVLAIPGSDGEIDGQT